MSARDALNDEGPERDAEFSACFLKARELTPRYKPVVIGRRKLRRAFAGRMGGNG